MGCLSNRWKLTRTALCVFVAVAALPSLAASAVAPETRGEYVKSAEPICETNVLANRRIFQGAKQLVKDGKLKPASTHFFRAATAFGKTIRQLAAIPPPLGDEARIEKWLDLLRDEKDLISKIGRSLASGDKHGAQSYSLDLNRNSSRANNAVLSFGFNYCRIEPSRFG
jgi:hypothetical protein